MTHDADFADVGGPKHRPSRARWYVLPVLLVPFSALTYMAVASTPGDSRGRPAVLATLATVTGPFVGAIARDGQACCLGISLSVAAACGPMLALGLAAQVISLPFGRGRETARPVLWTPGRSAWLAGGPVSFLHALS